MVSHHAVFTYRRVSVALHAPVIERQPTHIFLFMVCEIYCLSDDHSHVFFNICVTATLNTAALLGFGFFQGDLGVLILLEVLAQSVLYLHRSNEVSNNTWITHAMLPEVLHQ